MVVINRFNDLDSLLDVIVEVYNTFSKDAGSDEVITVEEAYHKYISQVLLSGKLKNYTEIAVQIKAMQEDFEGKMTNDPEFILEAYEAEYGEGSVEKVIKEEYPELLFAPVTLEYEVKGTNKNNIETEVKWRIVAGKRKTLFEVYTGSDLDNVLESGIEDIITNYNKPKEEIEKE